MPAQVPEEQLALHQQRAREAEENHDFSTAVREYRILVQSVPNNAELESNLGVALYFNHDLGQAAETFRHAVALKPSLFTPHLFLGLTMAQLAQPDPAIEQLRKAAAINGADPLVHTWLGYEYTAQARFDAAAEQFEISARQKPDDQDVWYALGRCYLELGKAMTTRLLQVSPDGGRAWQLAGEQFEARGNNGKALEMYIGALKKRPDIKSLRAKILALGGTLPAETRMPAKDHDQEDQLYILVEQYEQKAKDAFERISQIDPDSYRAHQVLGDAAEAAELFDDAIREYKIVSERKPDLPGIHQSLCTAYARTGRLEDAIRECETEVRVSPYSAEAYAGAARAYLLNDDYDRASSLLEKALTLDRPPASVYKSLGEVYLDRREYPKSIAAFRKYIAAEPRDSNTYYLLARAYRAVGDTNEAKQAIATFLKISSVAKSTNAAQQVLDAGIRSDTSVGEDEEKETKPK